MRIYFDTEFMEDGETIELLSIGMVREDGVQLYAEADWADHSHANDWVRANVLPHLQGDKALMERTQMRQAILRFVGPNPEFWAWYASYDWVVLCQLFGRMADLPSTWPQYVNDLRQYVEHVDRAIRLPLQAQETVHHALTDARWVRYCHGLVRDRERELGSVKASGTPFPA
jgi:hypothetical protein